MNKLAMPKFLMDFRNTLVKRSPEILTGIGIAGMFTTTFLAVGATPKAMKLIEMKKEEDNVEKLPKIEVVKTCWKCYVPAAVTAVVSTACLTLASRENLRRNAALATAYTLSETALREYKEKVVETIGEKKEQIIRDKIDKERVEKNPIDKNSVIITGNGDSLCLDSVTGRYFKSNIDQINKAVNLLNRRMLNEGYISLNEFYDEIGLSCIDVGDQLGWNTDRGLIELSFGTQLAEGDTPCIVVNYTVAPKRDYNRWA